MEMVHVNLTAAQGMTGMPGFAIWKRGFTAGDATHKQ